MIARPALPRPALSLVHRRNAAIPLVEKPGHHQALPDWGGLASPRFPTTTTSDFPARHDTISRFQIFWFPTFRFQITRRVCQIWWVLQPFHILIWSDSPFWMGQASLLTLSDSFLQPLFQIIQFYNVGREQIGNWILLRRLWLLHAQAIIWQFKFTMNTEKSRNIQFTCINRSQWLPKSCRAIKKVGFVVSLVLFCVLSAWPHCKLCIKFRQGADSKKSNIAKKSSSWPFF